MLQQIIAEVPESVLLCAGIGLIAAYVAIGAVRRVCERDPRFPGSRWSRRGSRNYY